MYSVCRSLYRSTAWVLVLGTLGTGSAWAGYNVIDITESTGFYGFTSGLSATNQVVLNTASNPSSPSLAGGYIYDASTQTLTYLGAKVNPSAISGDGHHLVGQFTPAGSNFPVPFQQDTPPPATAPTPVTLNSPYLAVSAAGINNSGVIAGQAYDMSDPLNPISTAYTLNGSTQTILPTLGGSDSYATGLNNLGQVVGGSRVSDDLASPLHGLHHAFVTSPDQTQIYDIGQTLPADVASVGIAINDNGVVLGRSLADHNSNVHAFVYHPGTLGYQDGTLTEISLGSQYNSYGNGINSNGDVVGSTFFAGSTVGAAPGSGGIMHGFIYAYDPFTKTDEMFDLNNLVDPTLNLVITSATGINDNGWISADGVDFDGNYHALLLQPGFPPLLNPGLADQFDVVPLFDPNPSAVPEPSSVALLGIGLGVASFVSWRRRTRRGALTA